MPGSNPLFGLNTLGGALAIHTTDGRSDLKVTLAYAGNALTGNGLQEQRLLDRDYSSVYTSPDQTGNHATFFNVSAKRRVDATLTLSGNVYTGGCRRARSTPTSTWHRSTTRPRSRTPVF